MAAVLRALPSDADTVLPALQLVEQLLSERKEDDGAPGSPAAPGRAGAGGASGAPGAPDDDEEEMEEVVIRSASGAAAAASGPAAAAAALAASRLVDAVTDSSGSDTERDDEAAAEGADAPADADAAASADAAAAAAAVSPGEPPSPLRRILVGPQARQVAAVRLAAAESGLLPPLCNALGAPALLRLLWCCVCVRASIARADLARNCFALQRRAAAMRRCRRWACGCCLLSRSMLAKPHRPAQLTQQRLAHRRRRARAPRSSRT